MVSDISSGISSDIRLASTILIIKATLDRKS